MKTSTVLGTIIVLVIAAGAWYYLSNVDLPLDNAAPVDGDIIASSDNATGPSHAMGLNGSSNQGNLGQPDTGIVQQPMADGAEGSVIGSNAALGTDSNTKLGTYLIAYNGMTLYTFTKDTGNKSTCYDECAKNWPPYVVGPEDNLTQLKAGVTGKVDTSTRTDGSIQVTYNGHPLYFWKNDAKSGDTSGQGVGGVWYVVKP